MYIHTTTLAQFSESEIRALNPNTSFGNPFVAPDDYALVFPAPQPAHDAITQRVQAIEPELTTLGHWEQRWEVVALDAEAITANEANEATRREAVEASRIASLWQGAYDYEFAQISGVAIGLLVLGVMQGLPKALAVKGWSQSIWTAYYTRKATDSTDTDYSVTGSCPHSVPELMAELGL
jgi:hypothetical protein